jgi:hypothetical protein
VVAGRLASRNLLDAGAVIHRRALCGWLLASVASYVTIDSAAGQSADSINDALFPGLSDVGRSRGIGSPSTPPVELDLERTRPAGDLAERFGREWQGPIARYAYLCEVSSPSGAVAGVSVLIVRLGFAYKDGMFDKQPDLDVPDPLILDADLRAIGTLPEGFPVDPPGILRVYFTDWVDNFPRLIRFAEAGQSALEPHPLPLALAYDPKARRFLPQPVPATRR